MRNVDFNGETYIASDWRELTGQDWSDFADCLNRLSRADRPELFSEAIRSAVQIVAPDAVDSLTSWEKEDQIRFLFAILPEPGGLSEAWQRATGSVERIKRKGFSERLQAWVDSE